MKQLFHIGIFIVSIEWLFVCSSESYIPSARKKMFNINRTIAYTKSHIILNGKRLHVLSGELHYFRLPSEYWHDRLLKLKAAGLNAVSTFVEWSFHEPEPRRYRFSGDQDVANFVLHAAHLGLFVLLRPGPYICADRNLGGLPYWLFSKYPGIQLRTTDTDFIWETNKWMNKLFENLDTLLYGNGGPIILVQVENEYGTYSSDRLYMETIHDIIKKNVGSKALLYTADGVTIPLPRGRINGTIPAVNLGVESVLETPGAVPGFFDGRSRYPIIYSEFYTGWFSTWGNSIKTTNQTSFIALLDTLMKIKERRIHVNFYMFFGGTNFEFYSGATVSKTGLYNYFTTSYDYSAPITEAGDLTALYYAIKNTLARLHPITHRKVEFLTPKGYYGKVVVQPCIPLLYPEGRVRLGKWYPDITGSMLPTFEQLWQRAGLMLYEVVIPKGNGSLSIARPRDRVYVFIDGKLQGVIGNMYMNKKEIFIKTKMGSRLSLLVENMGRKSTAFGTPLKDCKGILSPVKLDEKAIEGRWFITGFPLKGARMNSRKCTSPDVKDMKRGPVLFQGNFTLNPGTPLDTYFYPSGWGKGYVWINGHNLGRYWPSMGHPITLYVPGVWLIQPPGLNIVHLLELERAHENLRVKFIDKPVYLE